MKHENLLTFTAVLPDTTCIACASNPITRLVNTSVQSAVVRILPKRELRLPPRFVITASMSALCPRRRVEQAHSQGHEGRSYESLLPILKKRGVVRGKHSVFLSQSPTVKTLGTTRVLVSSSIRSEIFLMKKANNLEVSLKRRLEITVGHDIPNTELVRFIRNPGTAKHDVFKGSSVRRATHRLVKLPFEN